MPAFSPAAPLWDGDGHLFSPLYGDIYGSRQGALAQARHVFLGGNRLAERVAAMPAGGTLTVGETGFGTGLNFLAAWQLFESAAPAGARLHFMSAEKHPLARQDASPALAAFPELNAGGAADALLAQWPLPLPGTHRLVFPCSSGRLVTLTLLHGEAADMLAGADAGRGVDAWFFDGFSPQKNPAMWSPAVFAQAARLSAPGATFATWTVGEQVRLGLSAAGFAWERQPGFGKKMEMLAGHLGPAGASVRPAALPVAGGDSALVIGAGLAGCAAARALAERGFGVTLADAAGIGAGASGNPQGLVQPMLAGADGVEGRFNRAAFAFAIRRLACLAPDLWHPCGVLWLCANDKALALARRRLAKLAWPIEWLREVDAQEAGALAGLPLPHPGIHCPAAGWVSPAKLCRRLADHPLIRFEQRAITAVTGDEAAVVVVAAAEHTAAIAGLPDLRQTLVRGQLAAWPAVPASAALRTVLHFGHYITPSDGGAHTVGATHQSGDADLSIRAADREELLEAVAEILPQAADAWRPLPGNPRAGLRCSVADKVPVIGRVPGRGNLCVLTALGPRGISTGLLGAELLASQVCGEALPVEGEMARAVGVGRVG